MSKGTPLCGSWAQCSLDMLLFDGFLPSVGVSAALALGGVIKGSSSGLSQWQWAQQGEHPGLEKAKTTWLPHVQAHMVSRCEHHSCFVILQIMVVSVVVSALLRWCCAPWPPAPVFRASWCCWWCHGLGCVPPLPQAEGTAPVSTWLSGRSRCRRWWGPQLGVQTLQCSRVMVVIAAFVLPSGKKAVMQGREGHPFVLTHWQDSGSGSPDAVLFPRRALNPCREVIPSFPVRITLTVPN